MDRGCAITTTYYAALRGSREVPMPVCEGCGTEIPPSKGPLARKWCSDTCRKRGPSKVRPLPSTDDGLVAATRRELEEAERVDTMLGQAALALATRISSNADSGSAAAQMVKELRSTMEEALAGAPRAASHVDQLRELRERKRRAG